MTNKNRKNDILWIASIIAVMLMLSTAFVLLLINVFESWHG